MMKPRKPHLTLELPAPNDPKWLALSPRNREDIRLLQRLIPQIAVAPRIERALTAMSGQLKSRRGFSFGSLRRKYDMVYDGATWEDFIDNAEKAAPGRNRKAALTDTETAILRDCVKRCDSAPLALEALADDERCGEETRTLINSYRHKRNYPMSLLRFAHITKEDEAAHRGPRAFDKIVYTQYRNSTWTDELGVSHPLLPGDLFEMDDMSSNEPFWYEWPWGGDPLSDKYGVRMGRQMLAQCDVACGKWLALEMIGRVRDAYRAEDVVRFIGKSLHTVGIPRLRLKLERNVWMAKTVRGIKGVTDEGEKTIIGGVQEIVPIHYVYSSKGKGVIESSFDLLQSALALVGVQIGRTRGEFEKPTQDMLACTAGRKHPKDCGFLHVDELSQRIWAAMTMLNGRPKLGRILHGVPDDRWQEAIAEHPLATASETKGYALMPEKREVTLQGGHFRSYVAHYGGNPFSFRCPEIRKDGKQVFLGTGYHVLLCFDPADPSQGAWILNNEQGPANREHYALGEVICRATYAPDAPQFCASRGFNQHRREYTAGARTAFRQIGVHGAEGAREQRAADGHGSVVAVTNNLGSRRQRDAAPTTGAERNNLTRDIRSRLPASLPSRKPESTAAEAYARRASLGVSLSDLTDF